MKDYILGDPRFSSIKKSRHNLVYIWCKKEFRNLSKAASLGISVPKPFVSMKNVLVMELIGEDGNPAPLIRETEVDNWQNCYDTIINYVKKMYKGGLVHADLSEFNVLYFKKRPVIIDMAQAVLLEHPRAMEFLKKDVMHLNNFFKSKCKIVEWDDLNKELVSQ
jgi:RIO kinase 1